MRQHRTKTKPNRFGITAITSQATPDFHTLGMITASGHHHIRIPDDKVEWVIAKLRERQRAI